MSKRILITGASRGIGFLTARHLAEEGHTVFAGMREPNARNAQVAADLVRFGEDAKGHITLLPLDVTNEIEVDTAANTTLADGPLDVLINNAGIMPVGLTEAFTLDQARSCFDVNLFGAMAMTRAVLPSMRQQKSGLIINLSSSAGRLSIPYFGLYCASKWALETWVETLNYELEPYGVESVLIEPSGHGTDLVNTAPAPSDAAVLNSYGTVAEGREKLLSMFHDLFRQQDDITNAGNVARDISRLIGMDSPRPVRTQIGQDMGVSAINEATSPHQAALIEMLRPVYAGE